MTDEEIQPKGAKLIPVHAETHRRFKTMVATYDSTFDELLTFLMDYVEKKMKEQQEKEHGTTTQMSEV